MPGTWKKLVFEDSVPNLGNANLSITAGESRVLKISDTAASFNINYSDNTTVANITGNKVFATWGGATTSVATLQSSAGNLGVGNNTFSASKANLFNITSNKGGATVAPDFKLIRDKSTGTANDNLAAIRFQGDNVSGSLVTYTDMYATIVDPTDGSEDGKLTMRVRKNGSITSVLELNPNGGDAASDSYTANEQKLRGTKFHGSELEALTRRTQMVYQCGYNGVIESSSTQNAFVPQLLRVSNGVQVIDGTDYTNSTGIIMPFDGYVVGGSFSCVRASTTESNQGRIKMYLKKYTSDGTGDWDNDLELASALPGSAVPHPVSTAYLLDNTEIRSDAVKVLKGDMILPYISVATQVSTDEYHIDDVIAQFIVYSESTAQAQV